MTTDQALLEKLKADPKMITDIFRMANNKVKREHIAKIFDIGTSSVQRILYKRAHYDLFSEIYDKLTFNYPKKRRSKEEIEAQKSKQNSLLPDPKDQRIADLEQELIETRDERDFHHHQEIIVREQLEDLKKALRKLLAH